MGRRLVKSGTEVANRLAAQEAAEEAERKRLKASVKAALARPVRALPHLVRLVGIGKAAERGRICPSKLGYSNQTSLGA